MSIFRLCLCLALFLLFNVVILKRTDGIDKCLLDITLGLGIEKSFYITKSKKHTILFKENSVLSTEKTLEFFHLSPYTTIPISKHLPAILLRIKLMSPRMIGKIQIHFHFISLKKFSTTIMSLINLGITMYTF